MKLFKFLSIAVFVFGFAVLSFAADHVIVTESKYDFKTTVAKVKTCIKQHYLFLVTLLLVLNLWQLIHRQLLTFL